jgi:chitin disaccharide deacetylase
VRNLIVNADDLAWTDGVNQGIVTAHRRGLVTSASLMANGRAFASALHIAADNPELGVGVHLNLSNGPPTANPDLVRALLNHSNEFAFQPQALFLRILTRQLNLDQVQLEWDAQIQKVRDSGIVPSHLDGHKHVHMLPALFPIAVHLAKKHSIRAIRISHEHTSLRVLLSGANQQNKALLMQTLQAFALRLLARDARAIAHRAGLATTDYFCGIAHTGVLTRQGVASLLKNLPNGTTEFMCHPGYADLDLRQSPTRLQQSRQTELDILTDPGLRKLVATTAIRLISYRFTGDTA